MRNVDVAEAGVANPLLFQNPGFQINISKHVVGDKTDGEQYHQNHDQFQTPLLQQGVNVGFFSKNHYNVSITGQNDDQRYDKPRDGPDDAVRQVACDEVVRGGVETRVDFKCFGIILGEEHIGEDLNNDDKPHQGAYGQRVAAGDFPHHSHGVHDAQVPVDTDASEEADAAVEVQVEAEAGHLAERLTELPFAVPRVIVHEEGQGEKVQQVRHSQVEHEDVDVSDFLPAGVHASQPPDVGQRPDDEHSDEHGRQNGMRKVNVDGLADFVREISRHLFGFKTIFQSI